MRLPFLSPLTPPPPLLPLPPLKKQDQPLLFLPPQPTQNEDDADEDLYGDSLPLSE